MTETGVPKVFVSFVCVFLFCLFVCVFFYDNTDNHNYNKIIESGWLSAGPI